MIRWFANNGVAANFLMILLMVGGLVSALTIKLELFPNFDIDIIEVRVPYPGAAPEEVERGIILLIEEKVEDIQGIKKINSVAVEGLGSVLLETERGYDTSELTDKVKTRIDSIRNFPIEAEEPIVEELLIKSEVISIAIFGDTDEKTLKHLAENMRDRLTLIPALSQVEIGGIRDYEISINISEQQLQRYQLSFDDITRSIQATSIDLPGGTIKAENGEILLRTQTQSYLGTDFANTPVRTFPDGRQLLLGEIAEIDDGFTDDTLVTLYNDQRAVVLNIYAVGEQNVLDIATEVKAFVAKEKEKLPASVSIEAFRDFSFYLKGRLGMLIENGIIGLVLVFLVLTLFLRPSLAFFVMLGIPVSFFGAFIVMPFFDVSINLASLFGFILVLGIVVDDAIVVGESVFSKFKKEGSSVENSIQGTHDVAIPVTYSVITTMVAFVPILLLPGFLGKFFVPIPIVVMMTLFWSLVQSKLVLPYHLSLCKIKDEKEMDSWILRQQARLSDLLERLIQTLYKPFLTKVLEYRYTALSFFIGLFIVSLGLLAGNQVRFVFFPPVPSDYIVAKLTMPEGTPVEETEKAMQSLRSALDKLIQETEDLGLGRPFQNVVSTLGANSFEGAGGPRGATGGGTSSNVAEIAVELQKSEDRAGGGTDKRLSAPNLADRWREILGQIPGIRDLTFQAYAASGGGSPVDVLLSGNNFEALEAAAQEVKTYLATFDGLYDIKDNYSGGKQEIKINLTPTGRALGLTNLEVGRQVRQAFYGDEAQRIQRGRDDIRVMVRYPKEERTSLQSLQDLRIRTSNGLSVPFSEIATVEIGRGYPAINRVNRNRTISITADADKETADLGSIITQLTTDKNPQKEEGSPLINFISKWVSKDKEPAQKKIGFLDELTEKYPSVRWSMEGEQREQADAMKSLQGTTLVVLIAIYALIAIPFKSYVQPLIVMSIMPFGLIGAIFGHLFWNQPMSILSLLGFIALAGVLVNDSLVLVDYMNQKRNEFDSLKKAVITSGCARFRAIILTSLTTFVGILPMLFETSLQAQFLIPMAISLSFGILFATAITLFLVPILYLVLEDGKRFFSRMGKK